MLEANKKPWFQKLFALYNRNLLKRRFHSLAVDNLKSVREREKDLPLIIYANHSSWWDGLVMFEILKTSEFDAYVMMEEKQLRNLGLFRLLGAFSVVRENRRESLKSALYAVKLLESGKSKTLLIFPQGAIGPNDLRPLKFFSGLSFIAGKIGTCNMVPCSIRYEFLNNFKPEIFVKFGQVERLEVPDNFDRKKFTGELENKMLANLEELKQDLIENNTAGYKNLL